MNPGRCKGREGQSVNGLRFFVNPPPSFRPPSDRITIALTPVIIAKSKFHMKNKKRIPPIYTGVLGLPVTRRVWSDTI